MSAEEKREQRLAELLDGLMQRHRLGQTVDLRQATAGHPEFQAEIRELWGAAMLAEAVAARSDSVTTDVEPASNTTVLELPKPFGDYELLEEIGRGGMGVVYKAHQRSLDRLVAIKLILRGQFATEAELARFRTEAESVAQLEHPAIVPIYEVGEQEGQPYFSMKLIEGQTLSGRLNEGPVDAREAAELLEQIAQAIEYAHQRGVLHRDLKPANILIDRQGQPYVTDFGLAKRMIEDESLTRTGAVLGTPSYMAPEQAAGNRGRLGPACDVYSLGTLLYASLTGRPPFQAASPVDTVMMVLEQDPLPPRLVNPRADRDLELIALRCLQKPPELRYATAGDLASDLQAYLNGESISARSGQFTQVVSRLFRETHHATILENWGLLWMWHSLVLLVLCLTTNAMHVLGASIPVFHTPLPYLLLWGGGLAIWTPIFWMLRHRDGPVTFVERQIAHVWGGSVICSIMLFVIEYLLGLPVLTLSPVLGLTSGMVFVVKAGILAGSFYFHAAAMFATALAMALMQQQGIDLGISLFGIVAAATFFIPGWKYYHQRKSGNLGGI